MEEYWIKRVGKVKTKGYGEFKMEGFGMGTWKNGALGMERLRDKGVLHYRFMAWVSSGGVSAFMGRGWVGKGGGAFRLRIGSTNSRLDIR